MAKKQSTFAGKIVTLPKGTFVHAYLNSPDDYEGSVKYKCKVSVPNDAMDEFSAMVDEFAVAAQAELGCKAMGKRPWDPDEKTEGNTLIKTSCSGEYAPKLYDASGKKELSRTIPIMGGSVGRLRAKLVGYSGFGGGVSLRLSAVQVLELAERSSGFDEEDGYEAPDVAEEVPNIQDEQDFPPAETQGDTDGPDF